MANASRTRRNGGRKGSRARRLSLEMSPEAVAAHDAARVVNVSGRRRWGATRRLLTRWGLLPDSERFRAFDEGREPLFRIIPPGMIRG